MIRAHKIALDPTVKQEHQFRCAAGCARFAYNWVSRSGTLDKVKRVMYNEAWIFDVNIVVARAKINSTSLVKNADGQTKPPSIGSERGVFKQIFAFTAGSLPGMGCRPVLHVGLRTMRLLPKRRLRTQHTERKNIKKSKMQLFALTVGTSALVVGSQNRFLCVLTIWTVAVTSTAVKSVFRHVGEACTHGSNAWAIHQDFRSCATIATWEKVSMAESVPIRPDLECGASHDRDVNAAINLKNLAVGSTVSACRLESSGLCADAQVKLLTGQEFLTGPN